MQVPFPSYLLILFMLNFKGKPNNNEISNTFFNVAVALVFTSKDLISDYF